MKKQSCNQNQIHHHNKLMQRKLLYRFSNRFGSVTVGLLVVLSVVVLLGSTIYHVNVSQAKQYQLVEQAYRLELMTELTILQIDKAILTTSTKQEINYPTTIQFNTGSSKVRYDAKNRQFVIQSILLNGNQKEFIYELKLDEITTEEMHYEIKLPSDSEKKQPGTSGENITVLP